MSLSASTYYVSPSGSNSYTKDQATSVSTPWRTIQHAADNMVAGDTCLICSGTYAETVLLSASGVVNAPITFQAYNSEIVTITGVDSITGWQLESTNIYYAPMPWTLGDRNQVFQNGVMVPEARWPNAGSTFPWQNSSINPSADWAYMDAAGYTNNVDGWFADAALPSRSANYWKGATVHAMSGYGWVMQSPKVLTSSGTTLTTDDANGASSAVAFSAGNEYYLSGIKGEMDSAGEWYYDAANSRLYIYSTTVPSNVTVKRRTAGFNLLGRSYIKLVNLHFFGCTIDTDVNSTNEIFDGLVMQYLHHQNVSTSLYGLTLRSGTVLRNSELAYDSQALLNLSGDDIRVINNHLHDSGYMPFWTAMVQSGNYSRVLISHNTMHDAGRAIMGFPGRASIVEYNDMYNAMRLTSDGAVFYSNKDAGNSIIRYNLLHDSLGPVGHLGCSIQGFYLDSEDCNWVVHHNIIWNVPGSSIQINARQNYCMIFNNTCANIGTTGLTTSFSGDGETGTKIFNNLLGVLSTGERSTWDATDLRFNLYADPGFISGTFQSTNSQVIDQGTAVPGVTDGYSGSAPDLGALEQGVIDWTGSVGCATTAPFPDPVYSFPTMMFSNLVKDGGFESGSLSPNWTVINGSNAILLNGNAWTDSRFRSGFYTLQFGQGTSEVRQVVTGLQAGRRYKLYVATQTADSSITVKLGVRNYGYSALETTALATGGWVMNTLSFVTGSASTTAEIYVNVAATSSSVPVYVDDIAVERDQPKVESSVPPVLEYTFNQGSGVAVTDSSTYGRDGTISGTTVPAWQSGIIGNALGFDGVDDYVQTPSISTPTEVTICCWAKSQTALWSAYGCLVSKRPSFVLHPDKDTRDMRFIVYTSATAQSQVVWTAPSGFDITAWHHYAGVYSTNTKELALYVDGVRMASGTATAINASTGVAYVGRDSLAGRYLSGLMDDVRLYSKALTAAEMKSLADTKDSQLLHLSFDESAAATKAWDSSGYGMNGVLTNMNVSTAWVSGIVNGALSFTSTNSTYVQTPAMDTPTELTVCCWAKSNPSTWSGHGCLVSKRPSFVIHPDQGTQNLRFVLYTTSTTQVSLNWTAPTGFDIATWHHYAGVYSSATKAFILYVDGVPVMTNTAKAMNLSSGAVNIGRDTLAGRFLDGQVDDVRIYSRVLPWNELLDLVSRTSKSPYY